MLLIPDVGRRRSPIGDLVDLVVDALATYRLTRLATADVITEPARLAVVRRLGLGTGAESSAESSAEAGPQTAEEAVDAADHPPKLAVLITCRWCAGVWIATAVMVARRRFPRGWPLVARALALSAGSVLLAGLEDG